MEFILQKMRVNRCVYSRSRMDWLMTLRNLSKRSPASRIRYVLTSIFLTLSTDRKAWPHSLHISLQREFYLSPSFMKMASSPRDTSVINSPAHTLSGWNKRRILLDVRMIRFCIFLVDVLHSPVVVHPTFLSHIAHGFNRGQRISPVFQTISMGYLTANHHSSPENEFVRLTVSFAPWLNTRLWCLFRLTSFILWLIS